MNEIQMFANYPDVVSVEQLMEMLGIGKNPASCNFKKQDKFIQHSSNAEAMPRAAAFADFHLAGYLQALEAL